MHFRDLNLQPKRMRRDKQRIVHEFVCREAGCDLAAIDELHAKRKAVASMLQGNEMMRHQLKMTKAQYAGLRKLYMEK